MTPTEAALRDALETIREKLTPAGNVWTGDEPVWHTAAYMAAQRALSQPSPASSTAGEVRKLETVIAKAYQAARDAPELNMSNYDEDDVSALNNAMIEVYQILASRSGEPASVAVEADNA